MEELLRQYKDEMGWNDQSIIQLLCRYIENQQDVGCFEDFIRRAADEEKSINRDAWCPNDRGHLEFYTGAAVLETWKVDAAGHWVESLGQGDVLHPPSIDNVWECAECGADAVFSEPNYLIQNFSNKEEEA